MRAPSLKSIVLDDLEERLNAKRAEMNSEVRQKCLEMVKRKGNCENKKS